MSRIADVTESARYYYLILTMHYSNAVGFRPMKKTVADLSDNDFEGEEILESDMEVESEEA